MQRRQGRGRARRGEGNANLVQRVGKPTNGGRRDVQIARCAVHTKLVLHVSSASNKIPMAIFAVVALDDAAPAAAMGVGHGCLIGEIAPEAVAFFSPGKGAG